MVKRKWFDVLGNKILGLRNFYNQFGGFSRSSTSMDVPVTGLSNSAYSKMFSVTPVSRLGCSSITVKYVIRLLKKNYIHPHRRCQNFHQTTAFNLYRTPQYSKAENKEVKVSDNTGNVPEVTTFEGIKENTKTVWYGSIVIAGIGITAAILYVLFRELFSSNSPNNIYSDAYKKCIKDEKVIFNLGEPIKGYGEQNRRRRRQHVSHLIYEKEGVNYMRMIFYLKGSRKTATVHLEMKENETGNYEYRYLFVQMDEYPHNTIVLEDNRHKTTLAPLPPLIDDKLLQY